MDTEESVGSESDNEAALVEASDALEDAPAGVETTLEERLLREGFFDRGHAAMRGRRVNDSTSLSTASTRAHAPGTRLARRLRLREAVQMGLVSSPYEWRAEMHERARARQEFWEEQLNDGEAAKSAA